MEIHAIIFVVNLITKFFKVNNNGKPPVIDKAMALSMLQDAQTARGKINYAIFLFVLLSIIECIDKNLEIK